MFLFSMAHAKGRDETRNTRKTASNQHNVISFCWQDLWVRSHSRAERRLDSLREFPLVGKGWKHEVATCHIFVISLHKF